MFLFRKAVLQDFPNVYALKQAVIQNPYPGMSWSETYPSQEILKMISRPEACFCCWQKPNN